MRTGTEPKMGKQEGNTGRQQNMSPTDCDNMYILKYKIPIIIMDRNKDISVQFN